jgi:hypothetical protein
VGYVLSGKELYDEPTVLEPGRNREADFVALATFFADNTSRTAEAQNVVRDGGLPGSVSATAQPLPSYRAIVAGDVNGDGRDDVLLADSGFIFFPASAATGQSPLPNIGRAYLMLGRGGTPASLSLGTQSNVIIQDYSLGAEISALGDLNADGYGDFAVSGSKEGRRAGERDSTREGGLFVFLGQVFPGGTTRWTNADADIMVRRMAASQITEGFAFEGVLHATGGDFNADGRMDLAVGEPSRELKATGSTTILDSDQRGTLWVFYSVADRGSELLLTGADAMLRGEFEFDRFGALPDTPASDLDGDRLDDLVVGAAGADVITGEVIPAAGKAFVIYGSAALAALPPSDTIVDLLNRTVTGSGDFLVDKGTGRAEVFESLDIDGDGLNDFVLRTGDTERWYRFTTLGDGKPGNAIRITPGALDTFIRPAAPQAATATLTTPPGP